MKKFICLILSVLLLSFALVSCKNTELEEAERQELERSLYYLNVNAGALTSEDADLQAKIAALNTELTALNTSFEALKVTDKEFTEKAETIRKQIAEMNSKVEEIEVLQLVSYSETVTNYVLISVKNYGYMVVELYPDTAPITVENFQTLVSEKFYDGLTFHRVIENFMIQGGDPKGNGTGGSDTEIKGEFAANGVVNNLKHTRGVLSMARSNDPNSASSQFFICHMEAPHLDGKYAAFGKVIHGIGVVDSIAVVPTDSNDKPLTSVVIESMRFVTLNEAEA